MNERIQSLVERATTKEDTYPAGCNGHPVPVYSFDKEKFAELIVQECANFVHIDCRAYDIADKLMKHFRG